MTSSKTTSLIPDYSVENLTRGLTLADRVRVASTSAQRRRGLLGTADLAPGTGLWIDPCEAVHTFGMKLALDAVFLDAKLRVRKIAAQLKPNRVAICLTACSVLELKAGTAAKFTQLGDQLAFTSLDFQHQEFPNGAPLPVDKKA